jgi:hypothetical protein
MVTSVADAMGKKNASHVVASIQQEVAKNIARELDALTVEAVILPSVRTVENGQMNKS